MKRVIIMSIVLLLCLGSLTLAADIDRDQLFKQGVSAYVGEDYQHAIAIFHQLEESKEVSWELYYNLGNSYYRNGELGNAIRYWEKAKILAPSGSDIDHNLLIAEKHLIDKVVLPDTFPLFKWYKQMQRQLSLSVSIQLIGALFLILILVLGFIGRASRRKSKNYKATYITVLSVFLVLIILFTSTTIDTAQRRKNEKYAIILERSVEILSEPTEDAIVLFILHEGSKVRVNKNIEDLWSNISYFDDKVGWISRSAIGEIEE
jgi:tetratricopeptide (TPR) repeat protein